jgi:hypothetical protein
MALSVMTALRSIEQVRCCRWRYRVTTQKAAPFGPKTAIEALQRLMTALRNKTAIDKLARSR